MTNRFPGPWQIAESPNGFAVYDATGRHLGFFYGRTDPNMAGHRDFLMIDDARQIAIDFAMLPELLNLISARSEVANSTEDEKLAKLATNRSPLGAPEKSHLIRPDGRQSPQMLRWPSDPGLIPIAVAALSASYLFFGDSTPRVNFGVVPQVTANRLSAKSTPLQEAKASLSKATDITIESRIEPEAPDRSSPIQLQVQAAPFQPTVSLDVRPTENGIEAGSPPPKEALSLTPSEDASTCLPSASAVRQNYPEERPSWTLRALGHEGTRCWYPKKQTAPDARRPDTRRKETLQTAEELEVSG